MTKAQAQAMTTHELTERLRKHYVGDPEAPEWQGGIFVAEVGINGHAQHDGRHVNRRVDAIYAGFTSASGRLLLGHEIKTSRSDWRAELAKVGKADFWHDNCHQWWIVAPSTAIVPPEELPEGWGLKVPNGNGMKAVVRATTRQVSPSWDAIRSIWSKLETSRATGAGAALQRLREENREAQQRLREEYEVAPAGFQSPEIKRLRGILAEVARQSRDVFLWQMPTDEELVLVLVDLVRARAVTEDTVRAVESVYRNLEYALGPLKGVPNRIQLLLDQLKKGEVEEAKDERGPVS